MIERRVSHVRTEYRKVCDLLSVRLGDVKQVSDQAKEFTMILDDFRTWLIIMKQEVEKKHSVPIKNDVVALKARIEDCEVGVLKQ